MGEVKRCRERLVGQRCMTAVERVAALAGNQIRIEGERPGNKNLPGGGRLEPAVLQAQRGIDDGPIIGGRGTVFKQRQAGCGTGTGQKQRLLQSGATGSGKDFIGIER